MNTEEVSLKVVNINVNTKTFFKHWIKFTEPFHKLTDKQQNILALFLYHHNELKRQITNNKILWKEVLGYDTKVKIYSELDITSSNLENVLTQLRKRNIIIDNKIVDTYIPKIDKKTKCFQLQFNFLINDRPKQKED